MHHSLVTTAKAYTPLATAPCTRHALTAGCRMCTTLVKTYWNAVTLLISTIRPPLFM